MVLAKKHIEFNLIFSFNNNDLPGPQLNENIHNIERISNSSSVRTLKMLGVIFDETLSFDQHCSNIISKVNSTLYHLKTVKNVLSQQSLKKLYFAIIHPHFTYCSLVYG